MIAISWQVCQGEENPPKAVEVKSRDAEAILQRKANKLTIEQRIEAVKTNNETPPKDSNISTETVNSPEKIIKERSSQ
jgi:hypothetical protein